MLLAPKDVARIKFIYLVTFRDGAESKSSKEEMIKMLYSMPQNVQVFISSSLCISTQ